ncbi:unnamed protein product [Dovyalis caffra]|uniref:Uncharacterized protein n=1 Tax=Dovyalis caffra TaxID=77055 RepID=A0AAV1R235_9ROSI|nr:unnamed protein product [Dovyalis caffra]
MDAFSSVTLVALRAYLTTQYKISKTHFSLKPFVCLNPILVLTRESTQSRFIPFSGSPPVPHSRSLNLYSTPTGGGPVNPLSLRPPSSKLQAPAYSPIVDLTESHLTSHGHGHPLILIGQGA